MGRIVGETLEGRGDGLKVGFTLGNFVGNFEGVLVVGVAEG